LRIVIDALRRSVATLFADTPASDLPIRRDSDLDQTLYLDADADPSRVRACAAKLRREASLFRLGVLVLTRLVELLFDTLRSGRLGWFGLLLALIRIYHQARALAGSVRALLAAAGEVAPAALPAQRRGRRTVEQGFVNTVTTPLVRAGNRMRPSSRITPCWPGAHRGRSGDATLAGNRPSQTWIHPGVRPLDSCARGRARASITKHSHTCVRRCHGVRTTAASWWDMSYIANADTIGGQY
jgi:hypothetical protein